MKTIILDSPGRFCRIDADPPGEPGQGEALVRVRKIGVCGTDYHAFHGRQPFFSYPRILGHELGVEVVAVGPHVENVAVGDRCAIEPYFNCGHCPACRRGKSNCCLNLRVFGVHIDGGMRELALVPALRLHPSATLDLEHLALVEPLSIGAHAVARAQLAAEERTLIIGAGPIGLAVTQLAVLAGAQVLVMDINEQRLAFAKARWSGITCLMGSGDPLASLRELVDEDLPTAVFDATGNAQSMMASFAYVAHGGRLIFVGLFQGDVTFHDPDFHRRETTLLSSRNATGADFTRIISLLEAGKIDLDPWITHRVSSDQLIEELPRWTDPSTGVVKAVVAM